MIDTVLRLVIGVLIVLPVVAILALGARRIIRPNSDPRIVAAVSLSIAVVLVVGYLVLG